MYVHYDGNWIGRQIEMRPGQKVRNFIEVFVHQLRLAVAITVDGGS